MDSVSDTAATTVSMIALILSKFTSVPLDGYMGIVVALFIIATGIGIFKDTMNELLGAPASPETVQEIESDILSYEGVIGVHDLMVHDYGPGRMFASAHVEVPSDCDIMACHDTIDRIERDIKKKFAINIVLHMDPIVVDDEHINALREKVGELIKEVDRDSDARLQNGGRSYAHQPHFRPRRAAQISVHERADKRADKRQNIDRDRRELLRRYDG